MARTRTLTSTEKTTIAKRFGSTPREVHGLLAKEMLTEDDIKSCLSAKSFPAHLINDKAALKDSGWGE